MNESTVWALYRPNIILNPKLVKQQRLQHKIILKYEISIDLLQLL